jgi:hypothetical protein
LVVAVALYASLAADKELEQALAGFLAASSLPSSKYGPNG